MVVLLSSGGAFAVRRLFKGKAAKRPAATFVPGGSIMRAMDPWDGFCWTGTRGAGDLAIRGAGGADTAGEKATRGEVAIGEAAGGRAPVTEGTTSFS